MKPQIVLTHQFVSVIPDDLEERTLYISMEYASITHKCCCGCGHEVVTPLSPTDWRMTYDGVSISLYPSVGSWNLPCQSHYWVDHSRVKWATRWTKSEIEAGHATDLQEKARYYERKSSMTAPVISDLVTSSAKPKYGFWRRIKRRLFGSS